MYILNVANVLGDNATIDYAESTYIMVNNLSVSMGQSLPEGYSQGKNPEEKEKRRPDCMTMLEARQQSVNSLVCVGLDTDLPLISSVNFDTETLSLGERFASALSGYGDSDLMRYFNTENIKATYDLVCAYKLNAAYYESEAVRGMDALWYSIHYIQKYHPGIPVICDSKVGDIRKTNEKYAKKIFDVLEADAVTINPWAGLTYQESSQPAQDIIEPFVKRKEKGVFIWCKSSNPAAGQIQDLPVDLRRISRQYKDSFGDILELAEIVRQNVVPVYQILAFVAARYCNDNGNVGVIAGSTYPEAIGIIRKIVGDNMPILIPAVGRQHGNVEESVRNGLNSRGTGVLMSASSSIIYASDGPDFSRVARREAEKLRNEINLYRQAA
ncbi:MAG: orotidine 5'-phosphate decarboxylase [Candidatus Levybacteria bacterium RIFCSPLOWO2_01_FULL_38_21]|nr:MAG: orotidine 5'-phosphate decarboxylase [Candidatus Levybacteria bacterium RIFCSPLOWO2_01_FULL_38_21]